MRDDKAEEILIRFEKLKTNRNVWDSHWQTLRDLVRPQASDFNRKTFPGEERTGRIYDGTAPRALQELAAGLHSYMTSPASRWFLLSVNDEYLLEDDDILLWLEQVSDLLYFYYGLTDVGFNPAIHESYLDDGAFGTSILYQDMDPVTSKPIIRAVPLADCWLAENACGLIDTIFRKVEYTTRQAIQEFGDMTPQKIQDEKDTEKVWQFVHATYPRDIRNPSQYDSTNMAFASYWVSVDEKQVVRESGYMENPYHVSRWSKIAGEIYGRSPAMDCLPDIRMLNTMSRTIIRAAQKIVDPPIVCDDDGVILPLKTFPGAVILKTPGAAFPQPLETKGRVDIGLDMMNQRRDFIQKCFFVDYLRREQKKERQTQLEISDVRDEMHRMMGPMLGRLQGEKLGPLIQRSYNLLTRMKLVPPAPEKLMRSGQRLRIIYISPAARAQMSGKILALQQAVNDAAVFSQFAPGALDVVNTDNAVKHIFLLRDVSRKVLNTPKDIAAIRDQRNQQQQLAQAAQVGGTAASGIKDLALAKQAMANAQ